jgi:hypothetical protein
MSDFNKLVEQFMSQQDDVVVPDIYKFGCKKVKNWIFIQSRVSLDSFPEGFVEDVVLTFISRLYDRTISNKPTNILLTIANEKATKYAFTTFTDSVSNNIVDFRVDNSKILGEYVEDKLKDLSPEIRSTILYLLLHPSEYSRMLSMHKDNPEFYFGLSRLISIRKKIEKQKTYGISKKDFSTHTSKALLLSTMYSIHPSLVVLFLLLGDVSKFLQFCVLFSGESIQMPTVEQLKNCISTVRKFGERVEKGETITDYSLVPFVTEIASQDVEEGEDYNLTPILNQFLESSLNKVLESYDTMYDRLIKGVRICDPNDVKRIYKILSKELTSQVKLMQSINQSFGFVDSLRGLTENLIKEKENEGKSDAK